MRRFIKKSSILIESRDLKLNNNLVGDAYYCVLCLLLVCWE